MIADILRTRSGIETFYYSSATDTGWKNSSADDATNVPIDPLVPLAVRRRGTGALTLYLTGAVRRGSTSTTLVSGTNTFLALPNSVSVTPGELGLDTLVKRGQNPVTADNLLVFKPDGAISRYFYLQIGATTGWYDSSYDPAGDIPAGAAIVFQRKGSSPIEWVIPSPTPPPVP